MTSTRTPKPIRADIWISRDVTLAVTATPIERDDAGWSYDVTAASDGTKLGTVAKRSITRERRTPGRTYVDARWTSTAWQYRSVDGRHWFEVDSLRYGIERVARDSTRTY